MVNAPQSCSMAKSARKSRARSVRIDQMLSNSISQMTPGNEGLHKTQTPLSVPCRVITFFSITMASEGSIQQRLRPTPNINRTQGTNTQDDKKATNNEVSDESLILTIIQNASSTRPTIWKKLFVLGASFLSISAIFGHWTWSKHGTEIETIDPFDYASRTRNVLRTTPLIDGHNDMPYLLRQELKNKISDPRFSFSQGLLSHSDIAKMRKGMMGGQFWAVFMECPAEGTGIDDPTVSIL